MLPPAPSRRTPKDNMALKVAIVGLPNVGKSTLFNALTQTAAAQAANYPFCTIEPNVGEVAVPDARLEKLAAIPKSVEIIPARMTFVDIAGLVRGASRGEGLGNQFLANIREVDEHSAATGNTWSAAVEEKAKREGAACVAISARIEEEVAQLHASERTEFLAHLGLDEPGLDRLIRAGYALLGLITFFTAGPKETRAWTVKKGARAPEAAGAIHTDFEKGFIRAETIAYDDYLRFGGEAGARDAGRMRLEGRDYLVRDGDVLHFRFA